MAKKSKYVAENCMGDGKADLLHLHVDEKILKTLSVKEKRFLQEHQRQHAMAKKCLEFPDWRKKEMFFQHLNSVMDNKLIEPSIIIEYINQNQRGDK